MIEKLNEVDDLVYLDLEENIKRTNSLIEGLELCVELEDKKERLITQELIQNLTKQLTKLEELTANNIK